MQLQRATADFVRQMELKWSRELPEGRNPDITFMAHVWEDLRVLPKPLALHLACEVMSMVGHAVLRLRGFRMESCQVRCARSPLRPSSALHPTPAWRALRPQVMRDRLPGVAQLLSDVYAAPGILVACGMLFTSAGPCVVHSWVQPVGA